MITPNQALLDEFLATQGRGDLDALGRLMSDDITWTVAGESSLRGPYRGREAVLEFFRSFGARFKSDGARYGYELVDKMVGETLACVVLDRTAVVGGHSLEDRVGVVLSFANGKVTSGTFLSFNQAEADRFYELSTKG